MSQATTNTANLKICLLIPFFYERKKLYFLRKKKFPVYFEHFLKTFSRNKNISLKVITNIPFRQYTDMFNQSSISFYKMSLKQVFKLFKNKLGIVDLKYKDFRTYKICDFKPMIGLVFSDYLTGFDYWGYCDVDMIIGNLGEFLNLENMVNYDMIYGTTRLPGYMAIYKNVEFMNRLFQKSPDYLKVINSSQNHRFDECGKGGIIAMEDLIKQEDIKVNNMNFVHNDCGSNNVDREWEYYWSNGRLIDRLTEQEIGAFHFVTSKKKATFSIAQFQDKRPIIINKHGISFL